MEMTLAWSQSPNEEDGNFYPIWTKGRRTRSLYVQVQYVGTHEFDDVLESNVVEWAAGIELGFGLTRNKTVMAAMDNTQMLQIHP